jgi:DNA replication and repair protein RecF
MQACAEIAGATDAALASFARLDARIALTYRTQAAPQHDAYASILRAAEATDATRRVTSVGPHADDLEIRWDRRPARSIASQGQARALSLSLRLAELRVLEQRTGFVPVLLLDDVSSELDRDRTERLLALVRDLDAQLWLTTTDPSLEALLPGARIHGVRRGRVVPLGPPIDAEKSG